MSPGRMGCLMVMGLPGLVGAGMYKRLALILTLCPLAAAADPCDVQTAEMVQATGARFDHRSPTGDNVFLSHPAANEIVMTCRDRVVFGPGRVALSFNGAYPPAGYFDLVSKAAASSLRVPPTEVRRLAVQCHKAALAAKGEFAQAGSPAFQVECQAFARDGGGTNIMVFPPDKG